MSVYFIEAVGTDRVSIGHARSVPARLNALRLCSPVELRLLKTIDGGKEEAEELRARFAEHRRGEWFALAPLRGFIESASANHFQEEKERTLAEAVTALERWLEAHDTTPYRFALDNGIDPSVIRKSILHHRRVSPETAQRIERGTRGEVPARLFSKGEAR